MKPAGPTLADPLLRCAEAATARCRDAHALAGGDVERSLAADVAALVRVLAARARGPAAQPERLELPALGEDRHAHRLEKLELAHQPVAAAPRAGAARGTAQGELEHAHPEAALQDLRVGDARVGHVRVHARRAREARPRARAAADRLVVTEALVAEGEVVHRALTGREPAERAEQHVDHALT